MSLLADLGANVIRVDRSVEVGEYHSGDDPGAILRRGRQSIALDLKRKESIDVVMRLAEISDAVVEGFRPGVAERFGFGPTPILSRNPRIVYARMTGWGQDGPYVAEPGHDINYLALSGVLRCFGAGGPSASASTQSGCGLWWRRDVSDCRHLGCPPSRWTYRARAGSRCSDARRGISTGGDLSLIGFGSP